MVVQFVPWPPRSADDVAFLLAHCSVSDTPEDLYRKIAGLSYPEKFAVLAGMARDYGLTLVWPSGSFTTLH